MSNFAKKSKFQKMANSHIFFGFSSPPPKDDQGVSQFTDCIVTMVWKDGVNRTPCIGFTYNKNAKAPNRQTPAKMRKWEATKRLMRENGIQLERLICLDGTKKYSKENSDLVRMFLSKYDNIVNWAKIIIFRDKGACFLEDRKDVLRQSGVGDVEIYPPAIHELVSPNDNNLHGRAKTAWRKSGVDIKNNIASTLALMKCIDMVPEADISRIWTDNFLLDVKRVTMDHCRDVVSRGQTAQISSNSKLHSCYLQYLQNYNPTPQKHPRTKKNTPKNLLSELDGVAYDIHTL